MMDDQLTIQVVPKEEYVPAASFLSIVQNTLAILREVDAQISERRSGSLRWQITDVTYNSPLTMTIFGETTAEHLDHGQDVVEAYTDGLRQVDTSSERIPDFFTVEALRKAKNLVSVLNDGIERVIFSTPRSEAVVPTQRVAANVDELTQTYEELTSFEGRLESATIHGKNRFYVWDVLDGRISCSFSKELLDDVRELFGHRVSVYGRAKYSRTGRPLNINVLNLKRLRAQEELPQFRDFQGVNITGNLSSEAYVRSLRDAE